MGPCIKHTLISCIIAILLLPEYFSLSIMVEKVKYRESDKIGTYQFSIKYGIWNMEYGMWYVPILSLSIIKIFMVYGIWYNKICEL